MVKVPLGARSYSIKIGKDLLKTLGSECRRLSLGKRCAIVTDSHVGPLYGDRVSASLEKSGFQPVLMTVKAGESAKSLSVAQYCYNELANHRLERHSFIVALGGGVIGDLAGFLAATYLRGIPFVQVPTTLLAQVDSSVGGKVGINLKAGKNLVGAFHQPKLVVCDLNSLDTLPEREFRSGLAEVVKYGIIRDPVLFRKLESSMDLLLRRDEDTLTSVIARCCAIKAEVVGQDETEGGLRAILNFGHTIGHAIEAISGYGRFLHGEAISIGQVAAAHLSAPLLGLSQKDIERMVRLLERAGLPVRMPFSKNSFKPLIKAMQLDKKVQQGEIRFVLAKSIGDVQIGLRVKDDLICKVFSELSLTRSVFPP